MPPQIAALTSAATRETLAIPRVSRRLNRRGALGVDLLYSTSTPCAGLPLVADSNPTHSRRVARRVSTRFIRSIKRLTS
jgi:hypothetical protein